MTKKEFISTCKKCGKNDFRMYQDIVSRCEVTYYGELCCETVEDTILKIECNACGQVHEYAEFERLVFI